MKMSTRFHLFCFALGTLDILMIFDLVKGALLSVMVFLRRAMLLRLVLHCRLGVNAIPPPMASRGPISAMLEVGGGWLACTAAGRVLNRTLD